MEFMFIAVACNGRESTVLLFLFDIIVGGRYVSVHIRNFFLRCNEASILNFKKLLANESNHDVSSNAYIFLPG
jgi:hypothetical protein